MQVCIYCLRQKSKDAFNDEHVIPQSFGRFDSRNPTLRCVCTECNQKFGDTIELILGRDSVEGMLRFHYGIKKDSEFAYPPGGFKRSRHEYRGGVLDGMILERYYDGRIDKVTVRPVAQVGIRKKNSEHFRWFAEENLPHRQAPVVHELDAESPKCFLFMGDCQPEFFEKFKRLGWKLNIGEDFHHRQEEFVDAKGTYTLDKDCSRAIAKIAFNFLAATHDAEVALNPKFDEIREFITNGSTLGERFVEPRQEPILYDEKDSELYRVIHIVTIGIDSQGCVVSYVTLFNQVRYAVRLATSKPSGIDIKPQGMFFNVADKSVGFVDAMPNPKTTMLALDQGQSLGGFATLRKGGTKRNEGIR